MLSTWKLICLNLIQALLLIYYCYNFLIFFDDTSYALLRTYFKLQILLNNEDMDGQVLVSLEVNPFRLNCKGNIEHISKFVQKCLYYFICKCLFWFILADNQVESFLRSLLNYLVIVTCAVSMILCLRAIIRAQMLKFVSTIVCIYIYFG